MLKNYKRSYLVINIILFLTFIFLTLNLFVLKQASYLFIGLSLLVPTLLLIIIFGYESKSRRFKYETCFYVLIYVIIFLLVTYLSGLFIGFTRSVYKLNFNNLIHNIVPYALLIFLCEIFRYEIVRKGDGSALSWTLITAILILADISLFIGTYDLTTGDGNIKFICAVIIPAIFKNIILLYFSKHGGIYPCLIYRFLLDLKLVVVPIFPDFGIYFDCIIDTLFPVLMLFLVHFSLKKFEDEKEDINVKGTRSYKHIAFVIVLLIVLFLNILVSCTFEYGMMSIGSNSMVPRFNKGDAIIYEHLDKKTKLEVGQIIVFKKDKKTIVHRIIDMVDISDTEYVYYTKGDANADPDGYPILRKDIIGVYKVTVKYIGYPSVMLSELLQKKRGA